MLGGVIATVLGGAITGYAATKAVAFVSATKDMIAAFTALNARILGTAATMQTAEGEMVVGTEAAAASIDAALISTGIGAALVALVSPAKGDREGGPIESKECRSFYLAPLYRIIWRPSAPCYVNTLPTSTSRLAKSISAWRPTRRNLPACRGLTPSRKA